MQAVIMAAGKSTRAYPLTITRPKPLLKVANKTILERNLDNLEGIADEVILIVGYRKDMIKKEFGNTYKKIKIRYVVQKNQLGTGHAASLAKKFIKNRFILMAGDDIYSRKDIQKCIRHRYSILTSIAENPENFGVIVEKKGILADFVEKPKKFISSRINTSLYALDRKIFECLKKIRKSKRKEFEIPDAIKLLSKNNKINCVKARQWIPVGYPWDLLNADKILRKNKKIIGRNSKITGKIGSSSIGDDCIIEGTVKNSIVMDGAIIDDKSVIENSIIGENVHFSGRIMSKSNAYSTVKGKKIKIGRFGAVIGDNVEAYNVRIKAGCRIWPGKRISNRTISKDLM
jgi:UDP-N-acetylglucosamine diphosphorylase / glucose-1-phosphate thymidylyltransferase / UDP-N-acetylgalactosamine diphosphorylase / glucosamine-1-phosphate N-acetyltransferase / galactosamine-1-phosphate N-acetyltransferase